MDNQAYDPTQEVARRAYDTQIDDLITMAQAGEQAKVLLNGDVGREVRKHIQHRTAELLHDMATCDMDAEDFNHRMRTLQFEYKVINEVSKLLGLIIMQSEEAIRQFEQLQEQR